MPVTNDPIVFSAAQRAELAEAIVRCMRQPPAAERAAVVIDRQALQILVCGEGPAETHIPADMVAADTERYAPIPGRDRIETTAHIAAFLDDEFAPADRAVHRQALDALTAAESPTAWRSRLGEGHPAVQAFDDYMRDFHHVVARMLMHGTRHPQVGMLGTDRLHRTRSAAVVGSEEPTPDGGGRCPPAGMATTDSAPRTPSPP